MPGKKPPVSPPKRKSIVRAVEKARSAKKTVSKKSSKEASRPHEVESSSKTTNAVRVATSLSTPMEKSDMDDPKMAIQVPDAVREMGEKAVEQTEKAFGAFLNAAKQSVAMIPGPATDISRKTLALTEQNMKAAFEHARKLIYAKDMHEVMQIQSDFFKSQLAGAQEQIKQMGTGAVSAAKDVVDVPIR